MKKANNKYKICQKKKKKLKKNMERIDIKI